MAAVRRGGSWAPSRRTNAVKAADGDTGDLRADGRGGLARLTGPRASSARTDHVTPRHPRQQKAARRLRSRPRSLIPAARQPRRHDLHGPVRHRRHREASIAVAMAVSWVANISDIEEGRAAASVPIPLQRKWSFWGASCLSRADWPARCCVSRMSGRPVPLAAAFVLAIRRSYGRSPGYVRVRGVSLGRTSRR